MKSKRYQLPNTIDTTSATSHQQEYAHSLGISLPKNITKSDAKALIDQFLDEDVTAPSSLIEYARNHKILCSSYIGYNYLHNLMFDHLSPSDLTAFFIYCVYQDLKGKLHEDLDAHPYHHYFYEFAKLYSEYFSFSSSLKDYYGEDLLTFGKKTIYFPDGSSRTLYGGSKHTTAYKMALEYLSKELNMQPIATSPASLNTSKPSFWSSLFKRK